MPLEEPSPEANDAAREVVDAAILVHRKMGPGLREDHYRQALASELRARSRRVEVDRPVVASFDGAPLRKRFILDMVVDEVLVVELKAKRQFHTLDFSQASSYLSATGYRLALLLNFHAPLMKQGIKRIVRSPR